MSARKRSSGEVPTNLPGPAQSLATAYKTLDPRPLLDRVALEAFYRDSVTQFRGMDCVQRMRLGLERAWTAQRYKAFLMGHSGVGKSTELTRLLGLPLVESRFRSIRLSVVEDLDPVGFKPFDVLLVMMHEVVRRTAEPCAEGGAGKPPADRLLQRVLDWFAQERRLVERRTEVGAEAKAGAGLDGDSVWAKMLGIFASVRGEMKYASTRKTEVVEYRLSQLSSLIDAANALMDECNRLQVAADGREWLFVIEDFDKAGVARRATEDFFITYANVIRGLRCHLVFTLPIALGYSSKEAQLPLPQQQKFCIPDTMVFHRDLSPHDEARAALRTVLEARVAPNLFAPGQLDRLIVASGGNLRDLFSMTSSACDRALLDSRDRVEASDVDQAIRELTTTYERRLGDSPFDDELSPEGRGVAYEDKVRLMLRIYRGEEEAKVPNAVLYALLRSRAVQEFNGERWFGLHPVVVDILAKQGHLPRRPNGDYLGGTL